MLDKFKNNQDFDIFLYHDSLSNSLCPDILYLAGQETPTLLRILHQLQGEIIKKTRIGIQIKFETFKNAAIAYEEIRKDYTVKFAYKSQVPYLSMEKNIRSEKIKTEKTQ